MQVEIILKYWDKLFAMSTAGPSHKVLASYCVNQHSSPCFSPHQTFSLFTKPPGFIKYRIGSEMAMSNMSTEASYTRPPASNHYVAELQLIIMSRREELMHLATVSLNPTETFNRVTLICLSSTVNLRITFLRKKLTTQIEPDEANETPLIYAYSVRDNFETSPASLNVSSSAYLIEKMMEPQATRIPVVTK